MTTFFDEYKLLGVQIDAFLKNTFTLNDRYVQFISSVDSITFFLIDKNSQYCALSSNLNEAVEFLGHEFVFDSLKQTHLSNLIFNEQRLRKLIDDAGFVPKIIYFGKLAMIQSHFEKKS